jgi:hypothetical protein
MQALTAKHLLPEAMMVLQDADDTGKHTAG